MAGPGSPAGYQTPLGYQMPAGYQTPPGYHGYQPPADYQGYQGYQGYYGYAGPMLPPGYQPGPPPARPSTVGQRNVATTITALGSIALGVGATAIVSHSSNTGGQVFMVLLIWIAIAIINIAYARRP
jgi:hypothetical protein